MVAILKSNMATIIDIMSNNNSVTSNILEPQCHCFNVKVLTSIWTSKTVVMKLVS
jgi:hypothetical protein